MSCNITATKSLDMLAQFVLLALIFLLQAQLTCLFDCFGTLLTLLLVYRRIDELQMTVSLRDPGRSCCCRCSRRTIKLRTRIVRSGVEN